MRLTQKTGPPVILPTKLVDSGMLIAGGTGSGKSVLLHQVIADARERQVRFVVHDPAMEFVARWYRPKVDIILNPLDARCPYWSIGDELRHDGEAWGIAKSLVPPSPKDTNAFFKDAAQKLLAHLLRLKKTPGQDWREHLHVDRPTCHELADWLSDPALLDRRLDGSGLERLLAEDAPQQRAGVHADLAMVAETLRIVPRPQDATAQWSARTWAEETGDGCLFVTSSATTRARLVPLQTLWIDLLILRLMTPDTTPTMFILDELGVLGTLPQLHTAATETRKFQNPLVVGTQDPAQLEVRYGTESRTILAQFATTIILKLNGAEAQDWASKRLGEIETQRLQESRRDAWGLSNDHTSHNLVRQREPIAMPSEIGALAPMSGFIKVGGDIARLNFTFDNRPATQTAFIERPFVTTGAPVPTTVMPAATPLATPAPTPDGALD